MRLFFTKSRMRFGGTTKLPGNPGSVYTHCETAIEEPIYGKIRKRIYFVRMIERIQSLG